MITKDKLLQNRYLKVFLSLFLTIFFLITIRARAKSSGGQKIKPGGNLIVQVPNVISTLDSQLAVTDIEKLIIRNIQEGLLCRDPNGKIFPLLAASLPQLASNHTWRVPLRKGIFFHDGNELDAVDIIFTFNRLTNSTLPIQTRHIFKKIKSIKAIDKYLVELTTDDGCPNLSDLLTRVELFPLSSFSVEKYGANYGKVVIIGTGPFCFQGWDKNRHIILNRNWNYQNPSLPYLNSLTFEITPKASLRVKALRTQGAHVAMDINPGEALALGKNRRIQIHQSVGNRINQIYLNTQSSPFDKKALRLAIALGINRQEIIKNIFHGYATLAESCIPSWSWAHAEGYQPINYDPERAKTILNSEGYDQDNPFYFSLLVNEKAKFLQLAHSIAEQLSEIHVFVNIISLPAKELYDGIYEGTKKRRSVFQAALEDWKDFRYQRDPCQFTSELYKTSSPYNKVRLSDPVLDTIFDKISRAGQFSVIQEFYFTAEKGIMNTISTIYICYPHHIHGSRSRLNNFKVNPFYEINFKEIWLQ